MTKEDCLKLIMEELKEISPVNINPDKNLLINEYGIKPTDLIYVMLNIEKKIGKDIMTIFRTKDSNIMTINNLVSAIFVTIEGKL